MPQPSTTAAPVPGLEGYRFHPLPIEQRDEPMYDDGIYHQWGTFQLEAPRDPARLLLHFDSSTGPLGLNLTNVEKDAFQVGELTARVIWLTISNPVAGKVSFVFNSAMSAKLGQALLLGEESEALPWPPPRPGPETWRREKATFRTRGPTLAEGRWRVELTITFDNKTLQSEFLVTCDCPFEEMQVVESPDSPRGAGGLTAHGHEQNSFILIVRPSSLLNFDRIALRLLSSKGVRIASVERLFRP